MHELDHNPNTLPTIQEANLACRSLPDYVPARDGTMALYLAVLDQELIASPTGELSDRHDKVMPVERRTISALGHDAETASDVLFRAGMKVIPVETVNPEDYDCKGQPIRAAITIGNAEVFKDFIDSLHPSDLISPGGESIANAIAYASLNLINTVERSFNPETHSAIQNGLTTETGEADRVSGAVLQIGQDALTTLDKIRDILAQKNVDSRAVAKIDRYTVLWGRDLLPKYLEVKNIRHDMPDMELAKKLGGMLDIAEAVKDGSIDSEVADGIYKDLHRSLAWANYAAKNSKHDTEQQGPDDSSDYADKLALFEAVRKRLWRITNGASELA